MINEKMVIALNKQVNAEMYSAYLYLGMSSYFANANLKGSATWMELQAQEEMGHAMKLYNYLLSRGGKVNLLPIDAPPQKWNSSLEIFEAVLEHERKVTDMVNNLVSLAVDLKDYPTSSFIQWFVDEQVQEEATADEILQKMKIVGDSGAALLMLDFELGKRGAVADSKQ